MKKCPHCSNQVPSEANFCPYCMRPTAPRAWIWLRINYAGILVGIVFAYLLAMLLRQPAPPAERALPEAAAQSSSPSVPSQTPWPLPSPTETNPPLPTETSSAIPTLTRTATITPTITSTPTQTPTATPLPSQIAAIDGMFQVFVPAGDFWMGLAGEGDAGSDEAPLHSVYLDSFWIDQTEVTNAQYARCVAAKKCTDPREKKSVSRDTYYTNPQYAAYPVLYVNWEQASAYCTWAGRRLPSEAEWEKAARGGDGRIYPWGSLFDGRLLNYCDSNCFNPWKDSNTNDGFNDTAPAGSYPLGASLFGALDMSGNVYEWVADWYGSYSSLPQSNPGGPTSGDKRTIRGGSWGDEVKRVRATVRSGVSPDFSENFIGFRCAE